METADTDSHYNIHLITKLFSAMYDMSGINRITDITRSQAIVLCKSYLWTPKGKRRGLTQKYKDKITCASVWGRQVCPFLGAETPFFTFIIYASLSI